MPGQLRYWFEMLSMVFICLHLVACSGPMKDGSEQPDFQNAVWPKPPDQARIEYVRSIAAPEDLGIKPGFWNRVVSVFVGKEDTRLIRPIAVVMTTNEVLYVADPGAKAVDRYDTQRKTHSVVQIGKHTAFLSPVALAIDPENRVYVSDSALNQIFTVDRDSRHAIPFKTTVELDQPTGLAFDSTRKASVCSEYSSTSGAGIQSAGRISCSVLVLEVQAPVSSIIPPKSGVILDQVNLWVTDSLNFRVQHFTQNGQFISTLSSVGDATGNLPRPKGVATDSFGSCLCHGCIVKQHADL